MATYQGLTWKQRIERAKKNHKWKREDHQAAKFSETCVLGELNGYPARTYGATYPGDPELCWEVYQFANVGARNRTRYGPVKALQLYNTIHQKYGEYLMQQFNLEPRA